MQSPYARCLEAVTSAGGGGILPPLIPYFCRSILSLNQSDTAFLITSEGCAGQLVYAAFFSPEIIYLQSSGVVRVSVGDG